MVIIRRLVFKSKCIILEVEPSGSRAEGLNMIGSDTDVMFICGGAFEGEGGPGTNEMPI
jgi:predicted nucleotidyltransferase